MLFQNILKNAFINYFAGRRRNTKCQEVSHPCIKAASLRS